MNFFVIAPNEEQHPMGLVVGPFLTSEEAIDWADTHNGDPDKWWVTQLTCPDCGTMADQFCHCPPNE